MLGFPYEAARRRGRAGSRSRGRSCASCLARRDPERLLSPLVPAVDLLVLLVLELVVPDTYGAVRVAPCS